jgi:hypothetical protein
MPTVSTGGLVVFVTARPSTGILSGPGVGYMEFVSKEFLDNALKVAQQEFQG